MVLYMHGICLKKRYTRSCMQDAHTRALCVSLDVNTVVTVASIFCPNFPRKSSAASVQIKTYVSFYCAFQFFCTASPNRDADE